MGWGIWLLIIIDNHQKRWKDFVVDFCDQHWDKWRHLRYNSYRQSLVAQKPVGKKSDEKDSILTQDGNLHFFVKFFYRKSFLSIACTFVQVQHQHWSLLPTGVQAISTWNQTPKIEAEKGQSWYLRPKFFSNYGGRATGIANITDSFHTKYNATKFHILRNLD